MTTKRQKLLAVLSALRLIAALKSQADPMEQKPALQEAPQARPEPE
jgi:hypothetical protein